MKIIYHCFGGTHSSVLCAAIHLGIISDQHIPGYQELMNCPYFDKVSGSEVGIIHHMGRDERENDIYILGCRSCGPIVEKIIREMGRLLGIAPDEVVMVDTTPYLNILLKMGGFLSRGLGLVGPGRIILYRGIRLAFPSFKGLVRKVKKQVT
ncbi:MAG: DUF3189 family protein [Bacillota bacterium]